MTNAIAKNRILINPFFEKEMTVLTVLQNEYPTLRLFNDWYGVVPDIWYPSVKERMTVFSDACELEVKLFKKTSWSRKKSLYSSNMLDFSVYRIPKKLKRGSDSTKVLRNIIKDMVDPWKAIKVPVIGVGALYGNLHRAELTARLRRSLTLFHKRVSTVYADGGYMKYGLNCIAEESIKKLSFEEKILFINRYINSVVEKEKPEVVIVEVPGGMLPLGRRNLNGGGEMSFLYQQAAPMDYFICTLPLNEYDDAQIRSFEQRLKETYGLKNISFHFTNIFFSANDLEERNEAAGIICLSNDAGYYSVALHKKKVYNCYNLLWKEEIRRWGARIAP